MGAGLAWGRTQIHARKPWPHWNHRDKTAIDFSGAVISIEFKAKKGPLTTSILTSCITQLLQFSLLVCSVEEITFPRRNFFCYVCFVFKLQDKRLGSLWLHSCKLCENTVIVLVPLFNTSFSTGMSSVLTLAHSVGKGRGCIGTVRNVPHYFSAFPGSHSEYPVWVVVHAFGGMIVPSA